MSTLISGIWETDFFIGALGIGGRVCVKERARKRGRMEGERGRPREAERVFVKRLFEECCFF